MASSVRLDGFWTPLTFRTYWRAAATTSSSVASGISPRNVVMFRHMIEMLGALLLVPLDRPRPPHRRTVGVLAGVASGSTLAEQVPALVELHLEVCEPAPLLCAEGAPTDVSLLEAMLLVDKGVDAFDDLVILHGA
jgi:hypothetical protein